MNYSIYSADRLTHLKIVVVALIGGILVAVVGIAARGTTDDSGVVTARMQGYGPVVKAGQPVVMSTREASTIR
jgi:hypothetical protein